MKKIVVLTAKDQFGPDGPQPPDLGVAFDFSVDHDGDFFYKVLFPNHPNQWFILHENQVVASDIEVMV